MGEEWRILPWVGSGPRHDIEASLGRTEWRTAWRTEWKYASGGGWQPQVAGGGAHFQVSGLGHRVSGTGVLVLVQVRGDRLPNRRPLTAILF